MPNRACDTPTPRTDTTRGTVDCVDCGGDIRPGATWPHHKVVAALRALLELAPCMSEDDRERTQALLAVLERRALPHEKQLVRDSLATLER